MSQMSRFEIIGNPKNGWGKIRGCQMLWESGVTTPDSLGFCADSLEKNSLSEVRKELQVFFKTPKKYIVRSSGGREDSKDVSFAGKYQSRVISPEVLDETIFSILAEWVFTIWKEIPEDERSSSGILVQEFYDFTYSGVTFTLDPSGQDHAVAVEFSKGGCEAVVSGKITPQKIVFSRTGKLPNIRKNPIQGIDWDFFQNAVMALEKAAWIPVDIEWWWDGENLQFLQLRPITTISQEAYAHAMNLDEYMRKVGVCCYQKIPAAESFERPSNEEFSLLEEIFTNCAPKVLSKHGITFEYFPYFTKVLGQLYLDSEAEKRAFGLAPGSTMGTFTQMRNRWNLAIVPLGIEWSGNRKTFPRLERELLDSGMRACKLLKQKKPISSAEALQEFRIGYLPVFETNFLASSYVAYRAKISKNREFQNRKEPHMFAGTLSEWRELYSIITSECVGNSLSLYDTTPFSYVEPKTSPPPENWRISPSEWLDFLRETGRAVSVAWSNVLRKGMVHTNEAALSMHELSQDIRFPNRLRAPLFECVPESGNWEILSPGSAEGILRYRDSSENLSPWNEPTILFVDSIPPSLAYSIPENVVSVITRTGATLSHFAIVAREKGLPVFRIQGNLQDFHTRRNKRIWVGVSGWVDAEEKPDTSHS